MLTLTLGTTVMTGRVLAQSYVYPTTPTGGNIAPAITSSVNTQLKTGTLRIVGKLCLNADAGGAGGRLGTSSSDCISAWSDLGSVVGGPFVNLSQTGVDITRHLDPMQLSQYSQQTGYIHVKDTHSASVDQRFTTIAKATNFSICSYDLGSGDQGQGQCASDSGNTCYFNSDCGYNSTAVYATDSGVATNYAAYFAGTVYVSSPTADPSAGAKSGRICLNGLQGATFTDPPGGACISSWNEIAGSSAPNYVLAQTAVPPTGQNSGAMLSGVGVFGSAIAGSAAGLPISLTCGDGLCSSNENNTPGSPSYCPIDCAPVPPLQTFTTAMNSGKTHLTVRTSTAPPAGLVNVLIIRSTGSASTFQPINGVTYATGQTIGTDKIIFAGTASQNVLVTIPDDVLPGPGTYFYRGFQGNLAPRYGAPRDSTLGTVYQLLVGLSYNNVTIAQDNEGQINCRVNGDPNCVGLYLSSTPVDVLADVFQSGYRSGGWTGCDGGDQFTCSVTMNTNRVIFLNITRGGGGTGPPKTS